MKNRFLALLLAVAMLLSLMPVGVVAEGETTPAETLGEETVPAVEETLPEVTEPAAVEETEPAKQEPGIVEFFASLLNAEDSHKTREGYDKCGHADESITWTPVTKASDISRTESGCYYLENSLSLTGAIAVDGDVDITICLNSFDITAPTTGNYRRIFRISNGAKVTVCDCTADTDNGTYIAGTLTPGNAKGGVAWIGENGEGFALHDAVIDGTGITNTGTGGAICMETAAGNIVVKDAVIKNCTATYGGAIFISNGTSVVLENATITGNKATQRGGGFDDQAGNIVTVGGKTVITSNFVGKAEQNLNLVNGNRVLNISTTAPLTEGACVGISTQNERAAVTDFAVTTVTTQTDAAKYFVSDRGHDMVLKDGKVTITERTHNSGDYKPGHESVTDWKGTATLPATTGHYYLTSNVYLSGAVGVASVQDIVLCLNGYSIYQTGSGRIYRLSGGAKLTICDCTAHTDESGNYAAGKISGGNAATAGAFYMDGSGTTFNFYDGIITGNTTSGNGTIVNQNSAAFNMHGGRIVGNTATGNGGALYTNGTFHMSGGTISGNTSADAVIHITRGTVNLSGGSISGNTVTNGASGVLNIAAGITTISGTTISGSSAIGACITGGTVNMTDGKITGMTYNSNSGAAVTVKGGTFNLSGGAVTDNTSRGILVDGGTVNLSGTGKVANNTYSAADCSGIRVNSGKLEMTGGEISGNNSGTASGAGVTARGGQVIISGGSISGNTAANGAAVLVAGGNVTLSNVDITGNTATNNGVVRIDSGSLNIQAGTQISGNTSSGTRGVLYVNGGSVVMSGGVISKNIGHQDGGAVVLYGGSFTMTGGEISNHDALRGVLVNGGAFTLSGTGKVCNNTFSATEGAGIRVESGSFTMTGGEISGNDAGTNNGGGLRIKAGTVNITGGKIINNKAKNGAGIIVAGADVSITNTQISGNQAVTSAGGIYLVSGSLNLGEGTTVTGNSANYGGGIHISGGSAVLNGAAISGNTAGKRGAGVDYASSGTLTVGGKTVISGNKLGAVNNNLMLVNGRSFVLDTLTEGASVGITAELSLIYDSGELLLAANADQADLLSFVSYDTDITHTMTVKGTELYLLQDPNTVHDPHTEDECGHENVTWKAWSDIATMPAVEGHYYLTCDVNVASMVSVTTEAEITVCLNGFTVAGVNRIYRLSNGAKVNICDCTAHTDASGNYVAGKLIPGTSKGGVVGLFKDNETDAEPAFTLYDGIIDGTGVTNSNTGIAIRMEYHGTVNIADGIIRGCANPEGVITMTGGTLNISGGKLSGNNARGVLVQNGTFNLSGGEIVGNTFSGTEGVGVRIQNGVFNMTGGKIADNDSGDNNVAGIRVADGTVSITGGEITGNKSGKAPAVLVGGGEVTIGGSVVISGNTATHNGTGAIQQIGGVLNITGGTIENNNTRALYIEGDTAECSFSGGKISGNTAPEGQDGAGIRIVSGIFNMTGGEISGHTTKTSAAGMVIRGGEVNLLGGKITGNTSVNATGIMIYDGEITIDGTEISGNNASNSGGAVYQNGGKLTIGSKTKISGNTARFGAGIYCISGDLTIDGASITGNTASHRGGGVDFASDGILTISGAAKITGNTAKEAPSNLVLVLGGHFVTEGLDTGCQIGIIADLKQMYADGKLLLGKGVAKDELKYFVNEMDGGHTLEVLEDGLYVIQNPDTIHKPHESDECGHKDVVWTAWTDLTALPKTGGHYYLIADVELTAMVGVSTQEEITLCLNGFTVKQTGEGQRIYRLSGGAVLNLCDCTAHTDSKGNYISGMLTGGNNDANAGASGIYAAEEGTTLRLYSGKITGNKTEGSGGGIVAFKGAKFVMYGGEISENTAAGNGGGVYAVDADIELLGGRITKNTAKGEGGGVYCGNAAAKLDGTKITYNVGETAAGGMTVGKESKVEFVSGEISNNKGKNGGGMVIQSKGYVNMTGGRFSGNNATDGNGGAVYISREGTMNIRGGSVTGNTSKKTGGAIYVCDKLNIYAGSISGNHAGKEGGGLYITEASWKDANGVVQYSDGVVNMYGGTISGNTTSVSAAGVLVRGQRGYFNLRGGSITGNKALTEKNGGHGGGIIAQGKGNFNMYGGSITNNVAHNTSGGIGAYSNATVKLYGGTISGNKAYRGAGAYLAGKEALIDGVTITKNVAEYEGGGIYVSACKLTMDSGVISENEIVDGNGAGILLRAGASMILNDGEITGNKTPEGHGGGMLLQSEATLTMNGGLVAENYASLSGGGIRSSRCKVEILGGVIRDNVCDSTGGGIYGETELIMKNCSVTGNRITGDNGGTSGGAGIYLAQQTKYELENVTVSGNYAIGKAGGIQIGYRCSGTISGCSFTGNSASGNGGGILAYILCEIDMENTVVEKNAAVGNGGGIFVEPDSVITVKNCAVNGNSAKDGGGIHIGAKSLVYVTDTDIRDNSALGAGGAVYANGGVYLTDTKITGNANKDGSTAVVLDNTGYDTESYIPSVNQFKGDVIISGNQNGDLSLVSDAFVSIHGDGLGDKAEILVYNPDGGITDIIVGPYDYVRNGDIYTITKGETSLSVADPVTRAADETTVPDGEEEGPTVDDGKARSIVLIAFGGVFILALILAIAAVIVVRKRKKSTKNS